VEDARRAQKRLMDDGRRASVRGEIGDGSGREPRGDRRGRRGGSRSYTRPGMIELIWLRNDRPAFVYWVSFSSR